MNMSVSARPPQVKKVDEDAPKIVRWWPIIICCAGFVAQYVGMKGEIDALKAQVASVIVKLDKLTETIHSQDKEIALIKDRETRGPK